MTVPTVTTVMEKSATTDSPICAPVPLYDLQALPDERSKTLRSLLHQGHNDLALLLGPNMLFHSHMPHKLGSAYFLGFSADKLLDMYNVEATSMNYEKTDVGFIRRAITRDNWRGFLNHKKYTVSFTDFFDQEVSNRKGDWKAVVNEYLFDSSSPLINGLIGGLGHPLIHLAYAYEFQSAEVATEALSLGCTERDYTHKFMDISPTPLNQPIRNTPSSLRDILSKVQNDPRFDHLFDLPGYANIYTIFGAAEPALLEYWRAWEVVDPTRQLEEALDLAVSLAIGTCTQDQHEYDFYFAHTLTVGHAVRVLLPNLPSVWVVPVLRQFWMFVLYIYIAQLRPGIRDLDLDLVLGDVGGDEGKDWEWVREQAIQGDFAYDSHRLKVLRALEVMEQTWGWKDGRYLAAGVKFVGDFNGWTGFGRGVDGMPSE